jgi:hypothetical protein
MLHWLVPARLEDNMLPPSEEPRILKIIWVTPDGEETDSGIEYTVPSVTLRMAIATISCLIL